MNINNVKTTLENNFKVNKSSLLKMAIDYITDIENQIEKMKLCQNCKFEDNDFLEKPCCDCTRCLGEDIKRNGNTDNWEIKE